MVIGPPLSKGMRIKVWKAPRDGVSGKGIPSPVEGAVPPPQNFVILQLKIHVQFYAFWDMFLECKRCKKHRLKPYADLPLHALAST